MRHRNQFCGGRASIHRRSSPILIPMHQLTYADRELLLQTFDTLIEGWTGSDEELLTQSRDWAMSLTPAYGFEHALTRNVTVLSRYLVQRKADTDLAEIARGGLLYVLKSNSQDSSQLG